MIIQICVVYSILSQQNTWETQAFNQSGQANNRYAPFPIKQVQLVVKEHVWQTCILVCSYPQTYAILAYVNYMLTQNHVTSLVSCQWILQR